MEVPFLEDFPAAVGPPSRCRQQMVIVPRLRKPRGALTPPVLRGTELSVLLPAPKPVSLRETAARTSKLALAAPTHASVSPGVINCRLSITTVDAEVFVRGTLDGAQAVGCRNIPHFLGNRGPVVKLNDRKPLFAL